MTAQNGQVIYAVFLALSLFVIQNVNGECTCADTADTYYCIDTTRVSCTVYRDGNYDCPDFSDEVVTSNCPPYSGFTTASTYNCVNQLNQNSVTCAEYQDGTNDCTEGSDEYCRLGAGTFTCRNGTTIPCCQFRDGRNDCGDNSDEGFLYQCILKPSGYMFKCTMLGVPDYDNNHCQDIDYKYDNATDCLDGTDEQLYVGDECEGFLATRGYDCSTFIDNSQCGSTGVCECVAGAFSVRRGSKCVMRIPDDACASDSECSNSQTGLACNTTLSTCYCEAPYYIDNSNDVGNNVVRDQYTYCRGRVLGEVCVSNEECSLIPHGYCSSNGICECLSDWIEDVTDNSTCIPRAINDTCATTAQCNIGMTNAECNNFTVNGVMDLHCECNVGAYDNPAGDDCIVRALDEACTSDEMCGLISNGTCGTGGVCECKPQVGDIPWIRSWNLQSCSFGLGDLPCDSASNCSLHFGDNATCINDTCWCSDTFYESGYTSCLQFKVGDASCLANDCTHIANGECDSNNYCQCLSGYRPESDLLSCTLGAASTQCNFACQYPWAVALIIIGLLAIVVILIILVWKRPWKKPDEKKESKGFLVTVYAFICPCLPPFLCFKKQSDDDDEKKKQPGSVAPYSNGGPYGDQNGKPIWTMRPKSSNPVMYDHMHLKEPTDPEVDAFFSGGKHRKRHGQLAPLGQDKEVFVFRGQNEKSPRGRKSPDKSNVHDDGYHTCGFQLDDGTHCQFSTDSYYRMRMHKRETAHFIRESWHSKKGKKRKPRILEPLGNIAEETPRVWTDDEEDDATLAALNGHHYEEPTPPATASYETDIPQPHPSFENPQTSQIGRHIALAFASVEDPIEEPMDTEDTSNLISDDENEQNPSATRVVHITPQDLQHDNRPFTPEPTGVMSPGDISVTNLVSGAQGNPLDTSGISEVAKANFDGPAGPVIKEGDGNDEDDSSDDDDEDGDEPVGDTSKSGRVKSAKKKGKGKKEKGGKSGKKEKGGKKGKKDGDGKKGKKGDKKGGKDKKEKGSKKGSKSAKKNKNNSNNRDIDNASDIASDFDVSEAAATVFSIESENYNSSSNKLRPTTPNKSTFGKSKKDSMKLEEVFAMSNDVDPMQFSRRSIHEDLPNSLRRPESRCDVRYTVDTVTIPIPTEKKVKRQVSFSKTINIQQDLEDFSDTEFRSVRAKNVK